MAKPDYLSDDQYDLFQRVLTRMVEADPSIVDYVEYADDGEFDDVQQWLARGLVRQCIMRRRGEPGTALVILSEEWGAGEFPALAKLEVTVDAVFNTLAWFTDPDDVASGLPAELASDWPGYRDHALWPITEPGPYDPDDYLRQ